VLFGVELVGCLVCRDDKMSRGTWFEIRAHILTEAVFDTIQSDIGYSYSQQLFIQTWKSSYQLPKYLQFY
jgi:hypothetical protein